MGKYENKYTTKLAEEYAKQFDCDLISEYIGMNEIKNILDNFFK